MPIEALYWLFVILWALAYFGVYVGWAWAPVASGGLLLVLFILIGLKVMGPPLK
jgi:predicted membrane channel-forming protein YqfA (hemolysin III family)